MQRTQRIRSRSSRRRGVRILLLALSVTVMMSTGMYTPGPEATAFSRLMLVVFSASTVMSLAIGVVMIPAPADPREQARLLYGGRDQLEQDDPVERTDFELTGIPVLDRSEGSPFRQREMQS